MSWSASTTIPKGSTKAEARDLLNAMEPQGNDDCPKEREVAVAVAVASAEKALCSGAYGELKDHAFRVSVSGHCNPGNGPRDGWADDCVTISVSQSR